MRQDHGDGWGGGRFQAWMAMRKAIPFPDMVLGDDEEIDLGCTVSGVLVRKVFLENTEERLSQEGVFSALKHVSLPLPHPTSTPTTVLTWELAMQISLSGESFRGRFIGPESHA